MSITSVVAVNENRCFAMDEGVAGISVWLRYNSFGVNLQIMELASYAIRGKEMRDTLQNCVKLRVLRLSYETEAGPSGSIYKSD
jgi:hypothetical protein